MAKWVDFKLKNGETRPGVVVKPGAGNRQVKDNHGEVIENIRQDEVIVILSVNDDPINDMSGVPSHLPHILVDSVPEPEPQVAKETTKK